MEDASAIYDLLREIENRESKLKLDNDQLRVLNQILKKAEEKSAILNSIVECSDDAIISKDLNGIITSWNNAAERIFGYSPNEVIGQPILILIPADRQHEEPQILKQLRNGIRVDHFETQRIGKNGQLIDVSLTISPIKSSEGQIIGLSKIARDITFQKVAEVDSTILGAIIASSDDAIISKDLNSIITSWNAAAERIFGYTANEMIGQSILKLIPPDRYEEEPQILAQLKQGIRVDHFETIRQGKDGRFIDVSLTISPIKDKTGKVVGVSKIARDITDRKILEQKKGEFISFVSHELKTPLTSMRSYVQLARQRAEKMADSFLTNTLSRAESQTQKMEKMINDFLNISRFDEGHMHLFPKKFDLSQLIQNCVEDAALGSKHNIISSITPGLMIEGDPEMISLVVINLISNAKKYSEVDSDIIISCEQKQETVTVRVQDQGIGISKDNQEMLFQKFYRIQSEDTRKIGGFGIGLYLAANVVQLHGSNIAVESQPGVGSAFHFSLPLAH
jgi:two-component system sensor histidine kinase VicK